MLVGNNVTKVFEDLRVEVCGEDDQAQFLKINRVTK